MVRTSFGKAARGLMVRDARSALLTMRISKLDA